MKDMENAAEDCTILHNIACDEKRSRYTVSCSSRLLMRREDLETPQEVPVTAPNAEKHLSPFRMMKKI